MLKPIDCHYSPWKHILFQFLKDCGGKFILHYNFSVAHMPAGYLPVFHSAVSAAW